MDQGHTKRTGSRTRLELENIEAGETRGRFSTVLGRVEVWHCSLVESFLGRLCSGGVRYEPRAVTGIACTLKFVLEV